MSDANGRTRSRYSSRPAALLLRQRIAQRSGDRPLLLAHQRVDGRRGRQRDAANLGRRDDPQIRVHSEPVEGDRRAVVARGALEHGGLRPGGRVDALTFGKHARAAGVGDLERPVDLAARDQLVDVRLIEPDQPRQKRQPVVGRQQIRTGALDDRERGFILRGRLLGPAGGGGDIAQAPMRVPLDGRLVSGVRQRVSIQLGSLRKLPAALRDQRGVQRVVDDVARVACGPDLQRALVQHVGAIPVADLEVLDREISGEQGSVGGNLRLARRVQRLLQIAQAILRVALQHIRVAQLTEGPLVVAAHRARRVQRDRTTLHGDRAVELPQTRIAHAGVGERGGVHRELLEIVQRQHRLRKTAAPRPTCCAGSEPCRGCSERGPDDTDRARLPRAQACRGGPTRLRPSGRAASGLVRRARRCPSSMDRWPERARGRRRGWRAPEAGCRESPAPSPPGTAAGFGARRRADRPGWSRRASGPRRRDRAGPVGLPSRSSTAVHASVEPSAERVSATPRSASVCAVFKSPRRSAVRAASSVAGRFWRATAARGHRQHQQSCQDTSPHGHPRLRRPDAVVLDFTARHEAANRRSEIHAQHRQAPRER